MTRKFQQQEAVKMRARNHWHWETRCIGQQKSKTQKNDDEELQSDELQGVPDWLQEFRHGLVDESVPEHRDVSSSSHEFPSEPRAKWYRVSTAFLLTSRRTESAMSACEPKLQGLLAEDVLVQSCPKLKIW